jgi:uncharacterized membrane protein YphA (DoxX/SURF4 family)
MLAVVLLAQLATILITWPVWNVRVAPVNLPLLPGLGFSFGWLMILSLLPVLWRPRWGAALHTSIYLLACVADQYRLQPQTVSLIVLLWATVYDPGVWFARYYLAAMWLWAGLHKAFSPEWFGYTAWWFVHDGGGPEDYYALFAWLVVIVEIALGVLAVMRPKWAALPNLLMHLGIFLTLSPLIHNFNVSVWPWNLASGIVGAWVLRRAEELPRPAAQHPAIRYAALAMLFLTPAGFYLDLVNPHLAFVLYSGQMPRGAHLRAGSLDRLEGWAGLNVSFPDSPRMFVACFRRTAQPGEKLFIGDPRLGIPDRYFLMRERGQVEEVTRARFLRRESPEEVAGLEVADFNDVWLLHHAGFQVQANKQGLYVSAALENRALAPRQWQRLRALPNLHELKLNKVALSPAAVEAISKCEALERLELTQCTDVSDEVVAQLRAALPNCAIVR